jgi:hypothetical protein
MGDGPRRAPCSRRILLSGGAAFVAGGILGGAAGGLAPALSEEGAPQVDALPWPWAPIDPMEAGSRAYRAYLDAGG